MNSDVFLSLLALESNNRGYGQNVGSRSSAGSLGSATIFGTSLPTGTAAASLPASRWVPASAPHGALAAAVPVGSEVSGWANLRLARGISLMVSLRLNGVLVFT
jgi:hypothetical protein